MGSNAAIASRVANYTGFNPTIVNEFYRNVGNLSEHILVGLYNGFQSQQDVIGTCWSSQQAVEYTSSVLANNENDFLRYVSSILKSISFDVKSAGERWAQTEKYPGFSLPSYENRLGVDSLSLKVESKCLPNAGGYVGCDVENLIKAGRELQIHPYGKWYDSQAFTSDINKFTSLVENCGFIGPNMKTALKHRISTISNQFLNKQKSIAEEVTNKTKEIADVHKEVGIEIRNYFAP